MRQSLLIVMLALCACGQGSSGTVETSAPVVGPQGPQGPAGSNGTDGSTVTPTQLCENPVTTYPSTFAEIAFCIDGTLYAVYSANGGFLVPLLNGNYSSDGINASCDFTVTGCVITNQSN